jgi:hypothetical protein
VGTFLIVFDHPPVSCFPDFGQISEQIHIKQLVAVGSVKALNITVLVRLIVGVVDEVKRFDSKKCMAKYGALTQMIYQSGNATRLGRISSDCS